MKLSIYVCIINTAANENEKTVYKFKMAICLRDIRYFSSICFVIY